ncbi:MAG: hypothetical protein AAF528_04115 [Cyanobacteria bacterium P01_C01_bin.121]
MPVSDEQLKSKPQPSKVSSDRSEADGVKAHQQFEDVAGVLAESSNNRLGSLVSAVVSERKASVAQFCDVLEAVDDGRFDLMLIAQEMSERRQKRGNAPTEFRIEAKPVDLGVDLNQSIDCVSLFTGFSAAKAIAGI